MSDDAVSRFIDAFVLGDRTGVDGDVHLDRQDRLRADWPELWRALVDVIRERSGP